MPAAPLTISALVATTTVIGSIGLAVAPAPFAAGPAALAAGGLVILALVGVSGTLLARGRWARPFDAAIAVTWIGVGAAQPAAWGMVTVALAAITLGGLAGPWLGAWLRHLASTDGPPPAAVVALLSLIAMPAALALASPHALLAASAALAAWSLLLALLLARAVPGALTLSRFGHPVAAAATAILTGLPTALVASASLLIVAGCVWRRDVAVALVPMVPVRGEAIRFPPELTPRAVLDAAGLDDSGRRVQP